MQNVQYVKGGSQDYAALLPSGRIPHYLLLLTFSLLIKSLMHESFNQASARTYDLISAAINVHKELGPGLLESIYEWCLTKELEIRGYSVRNQKAVIIRYKGYEREDHLRFDILVDNCVLIEVKSVDAVIPIHKAQLLSYMKLLNVPLGLLINFNVAKLTDGVSRLILRGADGTEDLPARPQ